jgi:hypothetical protein
MEGSRRAAFEKTDKPALRPLPKTDYEITDFKTCKIGINYHVEYGGFFYSTPFEFRGQECSIRATYGTIEVFIRGERICAHQRHHSGNRYVTQPEHLPDQHKVVSKWNDGYFVSCAEKFGVNTARYIESVLRNTGYPVQAYRACMGVLREAKSQRPELVEAASAMALENAQLSGRYFRFALSMKAKEAEGQKSIRIVEHDNIRGALAFAGGGQNA